MRTRTSLLIAVLLSLCFAGTLWAAGGGSSYGYGSSNKLEDAQKAIDSKDYESAVKHLKKAEKNNRYDADIQNLLGYSYRKQGIYDLSKKHYEKALKLDPNHRRAHEYMGELYLKLKQPDEAKRLLQNLKKICGDCQEYDELKAAIDAYEKGDSAG